MFVSVVSGRKISSCFSMFVVLVSRVLSIVSICLVSYSVVSVVVYSSKMFRMNSSICDMFGRIEWWWVGVGVVEC